MKSLKDKQQAVYKSIEFLPAQIEAGWNLLKRKDIPVAKLKKAKNIIVCGMGGSSIGYDMVRHIFSDQLQVPVILNPGYDLPAFVDKNSLVIISSYSGNTEEVLSCQKQVNKYKASSFIITGGGKLAKKINDKNPGVIFSDDFNPSGEPRWGLGYSIGAFIKLLKLLSFIKITEKELLSANKALKINGSIEKLVKDLKTKAILIISAQHLQGNGHVLANQINETAKHLAWPMYLSEINHHFLEALSKPVNLARKISVLFLDSEFYSDRIKQRLELTGKVFNKQGLVVQKLAVKSKNKLENSFKLLQAGSYLCYHISVANKVDPIAIPWVDFFKKELNKKK